MLQSPFWAHSQSEKEKSYVPASRSFYSCTASHQGWRHDHQGCGQVLLYLGSILSSDALVDDIRTRLFKPAVPLAGSLSALERLWHPNGHQSCRLQGSRLGCESWVPYRRHVPKLEQFHMRCLWRTAMSSGKTTYQILKSCTSGALPGIEAFLISAQLRWTGHVIRMNENRLLNQAFYSQLQRGTRFNGGQRKRYKDMLKHNLNACSIDPKKLETLAGDRSSWRAMCKALVQHLSQNESQS